MSEERRPEYVLDAPDLVVAANRLDARLRHAIPGFDARCDLNLLMETAVAKFGHADPDLLAIQEAINSSRSRAAPLDSLPIYTVYDHPLDYPDSFVVRVSYVTKPVGGKPSEVITGHLVGVSDTLEGARKMLPEGLTCIARHEQDDPEIVESWL